MKRTFICSSVVAAATCFIALMPIEVGGADDDASPIFGVKLPAGYRDWQMVSVAHEAGSINDIRAILGNDIAMKAYREGTRPFPDGAIIARLAWKYVPSDENNAIFGQAQSFVPGTATNVQISVKDSKTYADTGGWGYGQFEDGKPNRGEALMKTCYPCHARAPKSDDFVFTRYAP
jgi:cytochrome P460